MTDARNWKSCCGGIVVAIVVVAVDAAAAAAAAVVVAIVDVEGEEGWKTSCLVVAALFGQMEGDVAVVVVDWAVGTCCCCWQCWNALSGRCSEGRWSMGRTTPSHFEQLK